jgi:hypothetical protein
MNKMKQRKNVVCLWILICLSLLIINGCDEGYRPSSDDVAYGTDGLVIEAAELQTTYYEGDYLNLELFVNNLGMYNNPSGKILIGGFDRNAIGISSDPILIPDVAAKSSFNPDGGTEVVKVDESKPLIIPIGIYYDPILQISSCYNYQTYASPNVCVLRDPEDVFICRPGTQFLDSQGAPIAVTEVTEEALENHVNIIVRIENLGEGEVVNPHDAVAFEECPYSLSFDDKDVVKVDMLIANLGEPDCTPSDGYVKLIDGEGMIACMFTTRTDTTHTTPVHITIDYAYTETIEVPIEIYATSEKLIPGHPGVSGTQVPYGTLPGEEELEGSSDCNCNIAEEQDFGGCVCLYIDGQEHDCDSEDVVKFSVDGNGYKLFEVRGSKDIIGCGTSQGEATTEDCPLQVYRYIPPYPATNGLHIWGRVKDSYSEYVRELCTIQRASN